jgi:putative ABC transport system ATP-binding protein
METAPDSKNRFDLVCGMYLDNYPDLSKETYDGKDYFFCGEGCAKRFKDNPGKFEGDPIIKLRGVCKTFSFAGGSKTEVLRNVNLNIWKGDFVAIIGASGSGKSTLLNMIGLLDRPTEGGVFIKGKEALKMSDEESALLRSKTFGFVFQQYNLIPWLSVYDNIGMPVIFSGGKVNESEMLQKINKVGLSHRINHRPMELSGGEQQRVALLRALANDPEIIIGDEPTGNLDSKTGNEILEMLIELRRKSGKTLIIVTHDTDIADRAEEVVVLKDGETMRDQRIHQKIYTE